MDLQWKDHLSQRLRTIQPTSSNNPFLAWKYTGRFKDNRVPQAVCDLCGNKGLRYQFLVVHAETGEALWVGSQCVLLFDVSLKYVRRSQNQARKREQDEIKEIPEEQFNQIILELQAIYPHLTDREQRRLRWAMGKFQRREAFSPGDLAWLFMRMAYLEIVPEFHCYPITLHTKQDRTEIRQMTLTELQLISACLTTEQRALCQEWGLAVLVT